MDAVEFPSHRHSSNLKLFSCEETKQRRVCGLCGKKVKGSGYECSKCDFTSHLDCAKNPPSLVIKNSMIHEHTLTLLPRQVSFTCNACGLSGDKSPYVCLMCCFMIHMDCLSLPCVININRHDHRIFYTSFLGQEKLNCGVCRASIEGKYGGFSCSICEDYFVHSRCAVRKDLWDGKDLEVLPDAEEDDGKAEGGERFVSPDDNKLSLHFSHQHSLKVKVKDKEDGYVFCSGCSLPIESSETFYGCDSLCDFFLHQLCADLPRKKNTFLHVHPLTLCSGPNGLARCNACGLHFNGFRYRCLECKDEKIEFDIRCCSVSEPFMTFGHKHPLYVFPTNETEAANKCDGCGLQQGKCMLTCKVSGLRLCLTCATLPTYAKYKYDEHLLYVNVNTGFQDVTSVGVYWCDVCEKKIERSASYYRCTHCGPVLHTDCAVGSFRHMKPGLSFTLHGHEFQVVLNDRTSQLCCSQCLNDCHEPLFLMSTSIHVTIYLCSSFCFTAYVSAKLSLL